AIIGEGWSILGADGERIQGARWIDYNGLRIFIGGNLDDTNPFVAKFAAREGSDHGQPFSMVLGYTSGTQNCKVNWDGCRIRVHHGAFVEIRASSYYELRVGSGAGFMLHLKEWLARLKAFAARFSRARTA
ncbi:MAG TPA: hypothetical protein VK524_32440, partial [Polyangiaceae bacterium]|nr:hypothetical protein [Polyangiaceae bacterium]